ncbi:SCO family protein [Shewanella sp. OPT22]|nr:SCO family protein [Shewanella sp. OPT22]
MKKVAQFSLLAILLLAGGFTAWHFQDQPLELKTTQLFPKPRPVINFLMTDHKGNAFTQEQLKGKWSLLFAGYTSCPDICPTTMNKLSNAFPKLNAIAPIQVVLISVDPQRDTPDKLNSYIQFFNSEFIAVTSEHKQLIPITRSLGMAYSMVGEGDSYLVDHSASIVLVSPKGERFAMVKPKSSELGKIPQIKTKALITDITQIMKRY